MNNCKAIQVGIVGYGFSGRVLHTGILKTLPQFHIKTIYDGKFEKESDEVIQGLPDTKITNNYEAVLKDDEIDLIVITLPNIFHYDFAKKAIEHGKNVVMEKPMVPTSEEAESLIKLAKDKGVILTVYHSRRLDNDFRTIKNLVENNVLGEINTYEAHYDWFKPEVTDLWREKSGVATGNLYDLGSHIIDQALNLFGKPQTVYGDVFAQRKGAKADDYFHVILGYESGLRVILHTGSIVNGLGPRYQVHGSKASFIKYGFDVQEDALVEGKIPGGNNWGEEDPSQYGILMRHGKPDEKVKSIPGDYTIFYKELAKSINEESELFVKPEEGLLTIKVIEAAKESSEKGCVIKL